MAADRGPEHLAGPDQVVAELGPQPLGQAALAAPGPAEDHDVVGWDGKDQETPPRCSRMAGCRRPDGFDPPLFPIGPRHANPVGSHLGNARPSPYCVGDADTPATEAATDAPGARLPRRADHDRPAGPLLRGPDGLRADHPVPDLPLVPVQQLAARRAARASSRSARWPTSARRSSGLRHPPGGGDPVPDPGAGGRDDRRGAAAEDAALPPDQPARRPRDRPGQAGGAAPARRRPGGAGPAGGQPDRPLRRGRLPGCCW